MELIDPSTGQPAYRCDYATRVWFQMQQDPDAVTTLAVCEKCGLVYKADQEHLHKCEDLLDPSTGALLWPGVPDRCPGNGQSPDIECCCNECDYLMECCPEFDPEIDALIAGYEAAEAAGTVPEFSAGFDQKMAQLIQETFNGKFQEGDLVRYDDGVLCFTVRLVRQDGLLGFFLDDAFHALSSFIHDFTLFPDLDGQGAEKDFEILARADQ